MFCSSEKNVQKETDPEDPFHSLVAVLASVRADWECKRITLSEIGKLVDAPPDGRLTRKVADYITNLDEIRKQQIEIRRLQEELEGVKAENFALKEDIAATRKLTDETQ